MDLLGRKRRAGFQQDMALAVDQVTEASAAGLIAFTLVGLAACLALLLSAVAIARTGRPGR